jgi:signal transduction histidine kinase
MTRRSALLTPATAGVSGVLSVTTIVLTWLAGSGLDGFVADNQANTWLSGVSMSVVAVLVLSARPENRLGPVFAAAGMLAASDAAASAYAELAFRPGSALPGADLAAWVAGLAWVPAFLLVLTGVPLLFPYGRLPSRRWRWPAYAALATGTSADLTFAFSDVPVEDVQAAARNPLPQPLPDSVLLPIGLVGFFVTLLLGCVATVGVAARMPRLGEPQRQQHAWFVAAVAILLLVTFLPIPDVVNFVGNGLFVAALGVAIVRYHLFDIELALSRALVYGLLTAVALTVYLAAVAVLGVSVGGGLWPAALAAVAALALASLRGRLQSVVERALYGNRSDPLEAMTLLGSRLGSTLATEAVLPAIVDTVRQSLRAPYAAVELAGESGPVHESGTATTATERFDLTHSGRRLGTLVVGLRRGESHLSTADRRLLTAFAQQATVAVHDASQTRELRRSRERIVLAREEERRRLRRNLHDGVGPALAGISLGLETAERAASRGDETLPALIGRLHGETDRCTTEVRQIVADLRPATLDSIGLLGALRQHAELLTSRSGNGFRVVVDGRSPAELPAAVEVAAYRIALEALTNTVRHAAAHTGTVHVSGTDELHVVVRDDGTGLPARSPGVGLASMRERAEEVGGTCSVVFDEGEGTTVEAVLPLDPAGSRSR